MMPSLFSFLKDEITQDIYDQTTADVNLESCYPLFKKEDLNWKYETGFLENIKSITKEFVDAKQIKPICILLYGLNDEMERNVVSKLSDHFHIPQLWLNTIVQEYIYEMEEKIKAMEELKETAASTRRGSLKSQKTQLESKSITGLQECQQDIDLQSSIDFFKKLNLKQFQDFKKLTDTQKVSIIQEKLNKNPCLNYGFILVNFPKTLLQAQLLFPKENHNDTALGSSREGITKPDFIVNISESEQGKISTKSVLSDDFVNVKPSSDDESLKNMSTDLGFEPVATTFTETNLSHDNDIRSFEEPIENTTDTEVQDEIMDTPKNKPKSQQEIAATKYFLDNNADCKLIKIETNNPDDVDRIFIKVLKEIEIFRHGDSENAIDLNMSKENTLYNMEESERQSSFYMDRIDKAGEKEIEDIILEEMEFKKLKEEEESILAINSCLLIKYLISYVFPTLTNAILEVTTARPDDPLDFIAEYLFVNNPEGHMMDPTEAEEQEELLNKPQGAMKIDSKACLA